MTAAADAKFIIQRSVEWKKIIRSVIQESLRRRMRECAEKGTLVNIYKEKRVFNMDIKTAYFFGVGNGSNLITNPKDRNLLSNLDSFRLAKSIIFIKWTRRFGITLAQDSILQSDGGFVF